MIYSETIGQGPDVVLLHGWGMHSGIWQPIVHQLASEYRVTLVDLPGHGNSPMLAGPFDLKSVAQAVLDIAPAQASWVGWSLGGMIATQAALLKPKAIEHLVLVASLPQFVQSDDWPEAMPADTLSAFAANLEKNPNNTLKRFLGLQVRGADNERELLLMIKEQTDKYPPAHTEALRAGLAILRTANLRPEMDQLQCPTHIILGDRDMLVPVSAARPLHNLIPSASHRIIKGAGHAPFLSHPRDFLIELGMLLNT